MARSRKKAAPSRRSGGARSTKATSRKPAAPAAAEVEVVEESKGLGIDDGLPILTALMLLTAFLLTDHYRGTAYGEGLLFKNSYEAPSTAPSGTPPAD